MNYVILSLTWTRKGDTLLKWWLPGNTGYTINFDKAGRYSPAEVEKRPEYYNNGKTTLAIRADLAEKYARSVLLLDNLRDMLDRPVWIDEQGTHLEQPVRKKREKRNG